MIPESSSRRSDPSRSGDSSAQRHLDSVAVVDIGSNTIKVLVASRAADGTLQALGMKTVEARISAGISKQEPRLSEMGMQRGVDAVRELVAFASEYRPSAVVLVATSAVRDARNGDEFWSRVLAATGHPIRLLSGVEEADLIGRGLTCDPALAQLQDFYVFDLGGGSLECLAFRARRIEQAISLQLGCVRMTEQFVRDPTRPLPASAAQAIEQHVLTTVAREFQFILPPDAAAVGTGGTVTTVRAILAARAGVSLDATRPQIEIETMRTLAAELGALSLADRHRVSGLPAARADVFPAALLTLCAVARAGEFTALGHSFYNLRFGLAAEALAVG